LAFRTRWGTLRDRLANSWGFLSHLDIQARSSCPGRSGSCRYPQGVTDWEAEWALGMTPFQSLTLSIRSVTGVRVLKRYGSALTALCGLVLLVATGCTENPPASTLPPPSTTPTSTPSTPPTQTPKPPAPVMPAAARVRSEAGLQAFARHWIALESYVQATGDSGPYLRLNLASCKWCIRIAGVYRGVYTAGGHYEGDLDLQIKDFTVLSLTGENVGATVFRGYFPEIKKIPSAGATPIVQKSALVDYSLNAVYKSDGWVVQSASMTLIQEGE